VIHSYTTPDNVAAAKLSADNERTVILALTGNFVGSTSPDTLTINNSGNLGYGALGIPPTGSTTPTAGTPATGFLLYYGGATPAWVFTSSATIDWSDATDATTYAPANVLGVSQGTYGPQTTFLDILKGSNYVAAASDYAVAVPSISGQVSLAATTTVTISNVTAGDLDGTAPNYALTTVDGDEYIQFTLTIGTVFGYQADPITVRLEGLYIQA
jgi:hypothetical protein